MQGFSFLFSSVSSWWILICIGLGTLYPWVLYGKDALFDRKLRVALAVFRGVFIFLLSLLLLNPLLRSIGITTEKPIIIFLQDNSASILNNKFSNEYKTTYQGNLEKIISELKEDYDVKVFQFGDKLKKDQKPGFTEKRTDISGVLDELNDAYSNQNIGAIILASDGIYNKGENPLYLAEKIEAPIYTIAMGDTTPQKDLMIRNVDYNRIVFLGNNFNINVQVSAYASGNEKAILAIRDEDKVVFSKEIKIDQKDFFITVPVTLSADKKGIHKYSVNLSPLKNEITRLNNFKTVYIEVLEGKQQILMLANAPHPDLSAIRQSIESNQNYKVDVLLSDRFDPSDLRKYQLVILHQLPSSEYPVKSIMSAIQAADLPVWYIIGNQTYTDLFNATGSGLSILNSRGTANEALPELSKDFYLFTLSDQTKEEIRKFPPLLSAYGMYNLKGNFSTLLSQKIGSVSTDQPLWTFNNSGTSRKAVLAGEGIWKWRLQNFQSAKNHQAIDELMSKTIQYLSTRDDKRRFRVTQEKNYFDEAEEIIFNAELYNDSYELLNDPEVSMELKNGKQKYNFTFSRNEKAYSLNAGVLPPGDYTWEAKTKLGKESYSAKGRFMIMELNAEQQLSTADHQLLYSISSASTGVMLQTSEMMRLPALLKKREDIRTITYEQKKMEELINLKWFFFLLLTFISLEWFLRKRNGGY